MKKLKENVQFPFLSPYNFVQSALLFKESTHKVEFETIYNMEDMFYKLAHWDFNFQICGVENNWEVY